MGVGRKRTRSRRRRAMGGHQKSLTQDEIDALLLYWFDTHRDTHRDSHSDDHRDSHSDARGATRRGATRRGATRRK